MENKQHVQVPHDSHKSLVEMGLEFIDPYIYACIKKYMNAKSCKAFPSVSLLKKECGLSREVIIASIKRLVDSGYIEAKKEVGKPTIYKFTEYTQFEIFSFEFLEDNRLSYREKAYLIAIQRYMYKDPQNGKGRITYSNKELAELIGVSYNTLLKYEKSLKEKGIMYKTPTKMLDHDSGLPVDERVYYFKEFANLIAFEFQKVDVKFNEQQMQINSLKEELSSAKQELESIKKQLKKMNATNAIIL